MEYAWVEVDEYEGYYKAPKPSSYTFDKENSTGSNAAKAEAFFKESHNAIYFLLEKLKLPFRLPGAVTHLPYSMRIILFLRAGRPVCGGCEACCIRAQKGL